MGCASSTLTPFDGSNIGADPKCNKGNSFIRALRAHRLESVSGEPIRLARTPRGAGDGEADNHRLPRQRDLSGVAVEARRAARRGATGRVGVLGRRCRTVRSAPCGCADAQSRGTAYMASRSSVVLLARLGAAPNSLSCSAWKVPYGDPGTS